MALRVTAAPTAAARRQRGFGIVRVSKVGKRSREQFISPDIQKERITQAAAADDIEMIDWYEELDVSGCKPLEKRHGLKAALERVERGEGEVIITAYLDRAARSVAVMGEVSRRLDRVGGVLMAADFGRVNGGSALNRLQTQVLMAMAEFFPAQTGEKTRAARIDALDRGIVVFPYVPLGYRKGPDRKLVVEPVEGPLVTECFRMRARGVSIDAVRAFLASRGIEQTYRQVQIMFGHELYLGQIKDGQLTSYETHEPLVDLPLFRQVQRVQVARGRKPRQPRMLSKLGLAVCGSCGGVLYVGYKIVAGKPWANYRCAAHNECPAAVSISAEQLEAAVIPRMQEELDRAREGVADLEEHVVTLERRFEDAQYVLDKTIEDLRGIRSPNTGQLLRDLQAEVDSAGTDLQRARAAAGPLGLLRSRTKTRFSDDFTFEEQQALLRALVARVIVAPAVVEGRRLAPGDRVQTEFL
jgi:DNA invertase Pin-like site-specific DNA recombinase